MASQEGGAADEQPRHKQLPAIFKRGGQKREVEGYPHDLEPEDPAVIASKLREMYAAWELPRDTEDCPSAVWCPEQQLALVVDSRGRLLSRMGFQHGKKLYLSVEEAVFLVDRCSLSLYREVDGEHRLVGVKEAYELMLSCGVTLEQYLVYGQLMRAGLTVRRSPAEWLLAQSQQPANLWNNGVWPPPPAATDPSHRPPLGKPLGEPAPTPSPPAVSAQPAPSGGSAGPPGAEGLAAAADSSVLGKSTPPSVQPAAAAGSPGQSGLKRGAEAPAEEAASPATKRVRAVGPSAEREQAEGQVKMESGGTAGGPASQPAVSVGEGTVQAAAIPAHSERRQPPAAYPPVQGGKPGPAEKLGPRQGWYGPGEGVWGVREAAPPSALRCAVEPLAGVIYPDPQHAFPQIAAATQLDGTLAPAFDLFRANPSFARRAADPAEARVVLCSATPPTLAQLHQADLAGLPEPPRPPPRGPLGRPAKKKKKKGSGSSGAAAQPGQQAGAERDSGAVGSGTAAGKGKGTEARIQAKGEPQGGKGSAAGAAAGGQPVPVRFATVSQATITYFQFQKVDLACL